MQYEDVLINYKRDCQHTCIQCSVCTSKQTFLQDNFISSHMRLIVYLCTMNVLLRTKLQQNKLYKIKYICETMIDLLTINHITGCSFVACCTHFIIINFIYITVLKNKVTKVLYMVEPRKQISGLRQMKSGNSNGIAIK